MEDIAIQMQSLDEFVTRARSQNGRQHDSKLQNLTAEVREPLVELQSNIQSAPLTEYTVTGDTPQKVQYTYPASLPRTESHESLIAKLRDSNEFLELSVPPDEASAPRRPNSP